MIFQQLTHDLLRLLYPHLCEGCRQPLTGNEDVLCIACESELPEIENWHPENETTLRLAGRVPFIKATSFCYFTDDGLLQHLLHGLKYQDKKKNGLYLGRIWGQRLLHNGWMNDIDYLLPVPLHPDKEAKRGYNQTLLIGKGLSEATGIPMLPDALMRVRNTESQTKKNRNERIDNMKDAFAVNNPMQLKNKHIFIFDDVLTTGATLEACATALLQCPGVRVSIGTIGLA